MMTRITGRGVGVAVALLLAGCGSAAVPPEEPPPAEIEPPAAEPEPPAADAVAEPAAAADPPPTSTAAPAAAPSPPPSPEPKPTGAPASPPPADSKAPKLPGANLNVESMNVDGLQVKHLSCKTSGGGLAAMLGTLTIAAGLSKRKTQLDRCSPAGRSETTVRWKQHGGAIRSAKASGPDAKRNACVERALQGAPAAQDAECIAVVVHGK